jgi:SAM-dependent methyltransferase
MENLRCVLEMQPMPLAGVFCQSREEALAALVFPLSWLLCSNCELVQVREDISDSLLFSHYNYSSSTVPGLVRHFAAYAEFLAARPSGREKVSFLEIGCNDGVLLQKLPKAWRLVGVDPSDVAMRAAAAGVPYQLFNEPFSGDLVRKRKLEESFDVISGSNCLAHISDIKGVFEAAALALRVGGEFWIEVHDLAALLRALQWDTIYHEHKVEWSEQSLKKCLMPLGFSHVETFRTPMHGGALRIGFRKESKLNLIQLPSTQVEHELQNLQVAYNGRYDTVVVRRLLEAKKLGKCIAAYGASGRANVYLNQLPELDFDYIVDDAPLRVNKFIPRVATPIVSPNWLTERPPEECLITAWNCQEDIIRKNSGHVGVWSTAFGKD